MKKKSPEDEAATVLTWFVIAFFVLILSVSFLASIAARIIRYCY